MSTQQVDAIVAHADEFERLVEAARNFVPPKSGAHQGRHNNGNAQQSEAQGSSIRRGGGARKTGKTMSTQQVDAMVAHVDEFERLVEAARNFVPPQSGPHQGRHNNGNAQQSEAQGSSTHRGGGASKTGNQRRFDRNGRCSKPSQKNTTSILGPDGPNLEDENPRPMKTVACELWKSIHATDEEKRHEEERRRQIADQSISQSGQESRTAVDQD